MRMQYIKRFMEDIALKLNKQYSAILITSPRQVGKTTMVQKLIEREGRQLSLLYPLPQHLGVFLKGDGQLYPIEIKKTD